MKWTIALTSFLGIASAAPSICGFGSSYSEGPGLTKAIGQIIVDKLNARTSSSIKYSFFNDARSGTNLSDVTQRQGALLTNQDPAATYLVSGGNDLWYAACLGNPNAAVCQNGINQADFSTRYRAALDAIRNGAGNKTSIPIYAVTYPTGVGNKTICAAGRTDCTFTDAQRKIVTTIYDHLVDYTVAAIDQWRRDNPSFTLRPIWMRANSVGHEVGTAQPWLNGVQVPAGAGGISWHPNDAGANAIATYIYNDLISAKLIQ